jgi:hypothetical protein
MLISQRIVQICLFVVAAIALMGGATQLLMGQPDTTPRWITFTASWLAFISLAESLPIGPP